MIGDVIPPKRPGAVKVANSSQQIPLDLALERLNEHPSSYVLATLAMLKTWPEGVTSARHLFVAIEGRVPEEVVRTLIAAYPDAVGIDNSPSTPEGNGSNQEFQSKYAAETPLHAALSANVSDSLLRTMLCTLSQQATKGSTKKSNTYLHSLATVQCETVDDCRSTNIRCYTLAEKGVARFTPNSAGHTPMQLLELQLGKAGSRTAKCKCGEHHPSYHTRSIPNARGSRGDGGAADCKHENERTHGRFMKNYHLAATFREIMLFKQKRHRHLSLMHFRDWTTVAHAWCTPSAKLTAITVLLVGETYKRGMLPRLPMDCWYMILNVLPRHVLRIGGCTPREEERALHEYRLIFRTTKQKLPSRKSKARGISANKGGAVADVTAAAAAAGAAAAAAVGGGDGNGDGIVQPRGNGIIGRVPNNSTLSAATPATPTTTTGVHAGGAFTGAAPPTRTRTTTAYALYSYSHKQAYATTHPGWWQCTPAYLSACVRHHC